MLRVQTLNSCLPWRAVALGFVLLAGQPASARDHRSQARPDFNGVWSNSSLTELERPDGMKSLIPSAAEAQVFEKTNRGKPPLIGDQQNPVGGPESEWWERDVGLARIRGQLRSSWIVSPADGKRPFTSAAKVANKARREARKLGFDGPEAFSPDERCTSVDAAGPPLSNGGQNDNFQFVQTADHLAIYAEWMHIVRVIRLSSQPGPARLRHPPSSIRLPMGDSVGWWDGDVLVIETTNFRPEDVSAPSGDKDADMRVVERLSRLSPNELLYAFSVTNPARYVQTWQAEMLLHSAKGPIYEYACHEGNYALEDMLAAARRMEGRTIDGTPAH